MKQDWGIKKLGDICNLYQPKTISGEMLIADGKYLVYGANGVIGRYNQYNHEESEVLLTCRGATCGSINVSKPYSWINGNAMVIHPQDKSVAKPYLTYYLKAIDWSNVITGAAQPQITRQSLTPLDIVIPPLAEQEKIVAELDCLSGIIEKKKQQLKELDALAQSIFYTMFGDPITNEKGWKEVLLKNAAVLKAGKSIKANELSEIPNEGLFPCYGGNGIRGYINKKSHNGSFPIIGRQGALCGNVVFAQGEFYATEHAVVCNNIIDNINPMWMYYTLRFNNLNRFAQGVAQPGISVNIINEMPLILPPLTLQQEFASKIEAIEKQKEQIKVSINDIETLFNARMQEYFE